MPIMMEFYFYLRPSLVPMVPMRSSRRWQKHIRLKFNATVKIRLEEEDYNELHFMILYLQLDNAIESEGVVVQVDLKPNRVVYVPVSVNLDFDDVRSFGEGGKKLIQRLVKFHDTFKMFDEIIAKCSTFEAGKISRGKITRVFLLFFPDVKNFAEMTNQGSMICTYDVT